MPAPPPPEFRQRAVELDRLQEKPIAAIAKDLGISESCLRRGMDVADVDAGRNEGLSSDERAELVGLRRELRVKDMEIEILKRASAFFARENVLPAHQPRDARPPPVRGPSHGHHHGGMITTHAVSGKPGQAPIGLNVRRGRAGYLMIGGWGHVAAKPCRLGATG